MADYTLTIQAKCEGLDKVESQIKQIMAYNGKDITINVKGNFDSQLEQIQKSTTKIGKNTGASISQGMTKGFAAAKAPTIRQVVDAHKQMQKRIDAATSKIKVYDPKIDNGTAKSLAKSYVNQQDSASRKAATEMQKVTKSYDAIQRKVADVQSKFGSIKSNIDKNSSRLGIEGYDRLARVIDQAERAHTRLNAEMSKPQASRNLDTINSDMKELSSLTKKATNDYQRMITPVSAVKREIAKNDFKKWGNENTKASKKAGKTTYDEILSSFDTTGMTEGQFRDIQNRTKLFKSDMSASGNTGKSWLSDSKRAIGQIAQFAGVYGMIQNVAFDIPKQMVQAVRDVDASMIELQKVSDAPKSQLKGYFDDAATSAKTYGSTISDVISSTADWSKLGYGFEEAKILSDMTTLYQKVGDDMTQESASESMISTLQGFKLGSDQAEHIVDSFNEVGNRFAIGSDGIGEALKRSSSSMHAAGNTMEETIGLVTAANEVVQDPDSVGTAFKTISMRIRGAKTDLEEAGLETEGMAGSTAELQEEIKALTGVDIMQDKNTFKSTYDVLDELSAKWSGLSDIQQATVTELIAGKRQGNVVSALMSNFDTARAATEAAINSDGSAMRELSNYQEGIEYSIDNFKASFQELSNAAISSDLFKGVVKGGSEVIGTVTDMIDSFGLLKVAGGAVGLFTGARGGGKIMIAIAIHFSMAYATGKLSSDVYEPRQARTSVVKEQKWSAA